MLYNINKVRHFLIKIKNAVQNRMKRRFLQSQLRSGLIGLNSADTVETERKEKWILLKV